MLTLSARFLSNKYHCFSGLSGWSGVMAKSFLIKKIVQKLTNLLQDCKSIDDVIKICKSKNRIENHLIIIITLNEIKRLEFVPFIKYDIKDIRNVTLKPLEEKLYYCKNIAERIVCIEKYIENPYRRFKKWGDKTKKNIFIGSVLKISCQSDKT